MAAVGAPGFGLEGRRAIVTGAAAGLGRHIALGLGAAGCEVGVIDRDAEGLASLEAELTGVGPPCTTGVFDVRSADDVAAFCERFGAPVQVLVNNAGGTFRALFDDTSPKGQTALVDENFTSVTHFVRHATPFMSEGASIVNITSIEAHRACPGFAVYAAMKAAVENLTRTLAVELGHRGIRVNAVAPDALPTGGEAHLAAATGGPPSTTPLGRLGDPAEIVGPVLFLASGLASFVTGTTLHVDGGNDAARGWRRQPDGSFRP